MDNTICCVLKIKRVCGCFEDSSYCGSRNKKNIESFTKKEQGKPCQKCKSTMDLNAT